MLSYKLQCKCMFYCPNAIVIILFQVKCIALKDIPSCTMQGLSKCPELRSLTLQNCGLLAVEGLEKCKELQELHVEVRLVSLS